MRDKSKHLPLLRTVELTAGYGGSTVLEGVDIDVRAGHITGVLGPNGAGKSTILRCISGLVPDTMGEILFEGRDISARTPHKVSKLGISHVLEGRRIFQEMTVKEHLRLAAAMSDDFREVDVLEECFQHFPSLKDRQNLRAVSLSGGEQQMLVLACALGRRPKVLLVDEPSIGLAPRLVDEVLETLQVLSDQGIGILLVEQNVERVLQVAQSVYVLNVGKVVFAGEPSDLERDVAFASYLGS